MLDAVFVWGCTTMEVPSKAVGIKNMTTVMPRAMPSEMKAFSDCCINFARMPGREA